MNIAGVEILGNAETAGIDVEADASISSLIGTPCRWSKKKEYGKFSGVKNMEMQLHQIGIIDVIKRIMTQIKRKRNAENIPLFADKNIVMRYNNGEGGD